SRHTGIPAIWIYLGTRRYLAKYLFSLTKRYDNDISKIIPFPFFGFLASIADILKTIEMQISYFAGVRSSKFEF
ncbi:hypothetical protein ACFL03_15870, partial [Thermodesulfobacteriota bacterium]